MTAEGMASSFPHREKRMPAPGTPRAQWQQGVFSKTATWTDTVCGHFDGPHPPPIRILLHLSGRLAENLGLPVPSYPVILLAAALAATLHLRIPMVLIVCIVAALGGDGIWYLLGRSRGRPILRRLCSLSLSPDSCVHRTERFFQRYGIKSLWWQSSCPD